VARQSPARSKIQHAGHVIDAARRRPALNIWDRLPGVRKSQVTPRNTLLTAAGWCLVDSIRRPSRSLCATDKVMAAPQYEGCMTVHEYCRYKRRYELRARERVPKVRAVGMCQNHTARELHEHKWVPQERSTSCWYVSASCNARAACGTRVPRVRALVCVGIIHHEDCMCANEYGKYRLVACVSII
jgi:hypothetical protein